MAIEWIAGIRNVSKIGQTFTVLTNRSISFLHISNLLNKKIKFLFRPLRKSKAEDFLE